MGAAGAGIFDGHRQIAKSRQKKSSKKGIKRKKQHKQQKQQQQHTRGSMWHGPTRGHQVAGMRAHRLEGRGVGSGVGAHSSRVVQQCARARALFVAPYSRTHPRTTRRARLPVLEKNAQQRNIQQQVNNTHRPITDTTRSLKHINMLRRKVAKDTLTLNTDTLSTNGPKIVKTVL